MSDLSGNRISFSVEDNITNDKIIRLESKLTDLKAKYQKAVSALSAIEDGKVYSPDRLYSRHGTTIEIQNIARLCRAELGEKE